MASSSILYYPSIEFHSDEWVKSSLLLWDNVYRIVPSNYAPNDNDEIKRLIDEDLIRNICPDEADKGKTVDEFTKFCENLPFLPSGLETDNYDLINAEKIDKRLYPALDKITDISLKDGWLKLSRELARGYMFYLSKIMAQRRNLVRGTDNSDAWSIAPYFTEDANFGEYIYDRGADGFYCSLFLEDLIPANIGSVKSLDIIKFVRDRKKLKEQLRLKLEELLNNLSLVEDSEQAKVEVKDFLNEVEKEKIELRKSMDFWKSDIPASLFAVGVPTTLTAFGAFGLQGDPFATAKIAGSILIGAVASFQDYNRTNRHNRDSSYASYLLQADKLADINTSINFTRNLEEFIVD